MTPNKEYRRLEEITHDPQDASFPITDVLDPKSGLVDGTFRHSPTDILRTFYARANLCIGACVVWGINCGFGFALLKQYSAMGVWTSPDLNSADASAMWLDFMITSFCIVFINGMLIPFGVRRQIAKGIIIPVPNSHFKRGIWRIFPVTIKEPFARAFLLACELLIFYVGLTAIVLALLCSNHVMDMDINGHCYIKIPEYIFIKSTWASGQAVMAYPIILLSALNRSHVPDDVYQQFLEKNQLLGAHDVQRKDSVSSNGTAGSNYGGTVL